MCLAVGLWTVCAACTYLSPPFRSSRTLGSLFFCLSSVLHHASSVDSLPRGTLPTSTALRYPRPHAWNAAGKQTNRTPIFLGIVNRQAGPPSRRSDDGKNWDVSVPMVMNNEMLEGFAAYLGIDCVQHASYVRNVEHSWEVERRRHVEIGARNDKMRVPLVFCVAAVFHTIFVASRGDEDHEVSTSRTHDKIILSLKNYQEFVIWTYYDLTLLLFFSMVSQL